jgi:predicted regulator of Ras-like GTPase activity (Roadblock/LC7/MglB family)
MTVGAVRGQLDWLLSAFVQETRGAVHAVVVSGDGMPLAVSGGVDAVLADRLSAAVSGLVSLARGTAILLQAEPVTQTIVEMGGGYLFATSVAQGSTLAVFTQVNCDMGLVAHEMTLLANRVGHALIPAPRSSIGRPRP